MTIVSLADKIRSAKDNEAKVVDVPEWGVRLELRSMSAKQRAGMQRFVADDLEAEERQVGMWSYILTSCVFDPETGDAVFTEDDMDWVLGEKSFAVLDDLTSQCLQVSQATEDSLDDAGKGS